MKTCLLIVLFIWMPVSISVAQLPVVDEPLETIFLLRVKQVNQFIHRFNNQDEDFTGLYRATKDTVPVREEAIKWLIAPYVDPALSAEFVKTIASDSLSALSLYDDDWFARATGIVKYKEREETIILSLRLYKSTEGTYQWVISGAQADFLSIEREEDSVFINPSSHETNFIALKKAFAKSGKGSGIFDPNVKGDDLTLLIYALEADEIELLGVTQLEFYFLQLEGWTFGIRDHNDLYGAGGWLISTLQKMDDAKKSEFKRGHLHINY